MNQAHEVYSARPSAAEMEDVLSQPLNAAVATINPDGTVHLAYVLFLYEAGKIYWETRSTTRKARNLAANPTTSIMVQGRAATGTRLMASTSGIARIITGETANEINHRLRARYVIDEALPVVNKLWDELDDICVEITPDRWRTWTGRKLSEVTMASFGDSPPESIWREA